MDFSCESATDTRGADFAISNWNSKSSMKTQARPTLQAGTAPDWARRCKVLGWTLSKAAASVRSSVCMACLTWSTAEIDHMCSYTPPLTPGRTPAFPAWRPQGARNDRQSVAVGVEVLTNAPPLRSWASRTQRRAKFAFRPWAIATAAHDTPGTLQAATTCAFNSALCFRQRRRTAPDSLEIVCTCPPSS